MSELQFENPDKIEFTAEFQKAIEQRLLEGISMLDIFKGQSLTIKTYLEGDTLEIGVSSNELKTIEEIGEKFRYSSEEDIMKLSKSNNGQWNNLILYISISSFLPKTVFISMIDVSSDFQRKGISRNLIAGLGEVAFQAGFRFLTALDTQTGSTQMLVKQGFHAFEELKPEYLDEFYDTTKENEGFAPDNVLSIKFLDPTDDKKYLKPDRINADPAERLAYLESQRKSEKIDKIGKILSELRKDLEKEIKKGRSKRVESQIKRLIEIVSNLNRYLPNNIQYQTKSLNPRKFNVLTELKVILKILELNQEELAQVMSLEEMGWI